VVLGVLHVGFVSRFISASVQAGFMFGLGLTIIVGQVPALLGVSKGEGDFFPQLWHLLTRLGDVDGWTAAVGLGCLALLLALKRVAPGIPAALLVVVASIVVVALGDLADHGVDVIGEIEGAVPVELFQRGVALWLANARAEVQDLLRRSGLTEAVGEARIYRSLADAIPDARAALRS
jgi:sulfate permease, SulP family